MIKKISGLIILIGLIWFAASAQIFAEESAANTGLSFLKLGAGSRAVAMGEAYAAASNDVSSTYWNPAGLARIQGTELLFTHNEWLQDITNEFFAVGFLSGKNAFGFSFMSSTIGGIERRVKPTAEPLDVIDAHSVMFGLSYARSINPNISMGLNVKYLYEKIYIESASGMAVDIGVNYKTMINGLAAGFAVQNLGFMTELKDESSELPKTARVGLAYQVPVQALQGQFVFAADWVKVLDSSTHFNVGMEYAFLKNLALRFGYQTGWDDKGLHAGFGINFKRYIFDYAYVPFSSDLGNSHRISFGVKF